MSVPSVVSERMWVCPSPSWALSPKALPSADSELVAAPGTASGTIRRFLWGRHVAVLSGATHRASPDHVSVRLGATVDTIAGLLK